MGSEVKDSHKFAECKSKRIVWSYQNIFNTVFIVLFLLSSVGLWICLMEINKLKQSTNSLVETVRYLRNNPSYIQMNELKENDRKHRRQNINNRSDFKVIFETIQNEEKHMRKRAAVPIEKAYDPLSPAPQRVSKIILFQETDHMLIYYSDFLLSYQC